MEVVRVPNMLNMLVPVYHQRKLTNRRKSGSLSVELRTTDIPSSKKLVPQKKQTICSLIKGLKKVKKKDIHRWHRRMDHLHPVHYERMLQDVVSSDYSSHYLCYVDHALHSFLSPPVLDADPENDYSYLRLLFCYFQIISNSFFFSFICHKQTDLSQ